MKKFAIWVFGVLTGLAMAGTLALALQPHCPTEDSCKPDYRDSWHGKYYKIVELIP